MIRRLFAGLALALVASVAAAQPAQWNYAAPPGANSTATYPGDVIILGACTGCSGVNLLTQANTWLATQTFAGSATTLDVAVSNIGETATITAAAPSATTNYDVLTQSVQFYTTAATVNWTLNLRGSATTSLNSAMAIGQALTIAFVSTQGATAFFNSAVQIDGVSVTPKWQGGTAPTSGNVSGLDVYTFTVIKTASATYTVLASQVQFK